MLEPGMKKLLFFIILISDYTYGQVIVNGVRDTINPIINRPQHDPPLVINSYSEVLSLDVCKNELRVNDPTQFLVGDTVLLIQMKGAVIDTSNTAAFGTIIDYKNAGNYEMNYVSAKLGNVITLKNTITRQYDVPDGVVQLIRVPYIKLTNHNGEYTCLAWDGTKGGVLVLNAQTINLLDDIEVSGTGFRPGELMSSTGSICFQNNYNYPGTSMAAAQKGESIAVISQNISKGKGSPASGGGGGLGINSGGGGGGNAGSGGYGGYQSDSCGNAPFDNRGIGGKSFAYNTFSNKIFMGGGGGAGHTERVSTGSFLDGAGGGIAIIIADVYTSNSLKILASGYEARVCNVSGCNIGMGGGGGGGTVLLYVNQITDSVFVETKGGNGADMSGAIIPGGRVGTGGGGGGGVFFLNRSALAGNVSAVSTGGLNGVILADANNPWGATQGTGGITILDLPNPFDTILFKPNIDSVNIIDSLITCNSFSFKGEGFTNTNPINSWYWDFGDGTTALTQNAFHAYSVQNTYTVKLIVTDINGCKDSITTTVNPKIVTVDAGVNKSFCSNIPVSVILNGAGTGSFAWTPAVYLNDSTLQNPTATIGTTTTFYLTLANTGCTVSDSVKIIVTPVPVVNVSKSNDINCYLPYSRLKASGASAYLWQPSSTLNNSNIDNPIANPSVTTTYFVTGTNDNICYAKDSITVVANFSTGKFVLPNSFTPNRDGLNDCFGIRYYRDVQNLVFIIYNRYGVKIFETNNAAECWNGYYKGQPAEPGNYVYYLSAKTLCGDVVKKGNVLLIR